MGTCPNSVTNGGDGCHLCDVVASGGVTYTVERRWGQDTISMVPNHRPKDAVLKREAALNRKQAEKAATKKGRK